MSNDRPRTLTRPGGGNRPFDGVYTNLAEWVANVFPGNPFGDDYDQVRPGQQAFACTLPDGSAHLDGCFALPRMWSERSQLPAVLVDFASFAAAAPDCCRRFGVAPKQDSTNAKTVATPLQSLACLWDGAAKLEAFAADPDTDVRFSDGLVELLRLRGLLDDERDEFGRNAYDTVVGRFDDALVALSTANTLSRSRVWATYALRGMSERRLRDLFDAASPGADPAWLAGVVEQLKYAAKQSGDPFSDYETFMEHADHVAVVADRQPDREQRLRTMVDLLDRLGQDLADGTAGVDQVLVSVSVSDDPAQELLLAGHAAVEFTLSHTPVQLSPGFRDVKQRMYVLPFVVALGLPGRYTARGPVPSWFLDVPRDEWPAMLDLLANVDGQWDALRATRVV